MGNKVRADAWCRFPQTSQSTVFPTCPGRAAQGSGCFSSWLWILSKKTDRQTSIRSGCLKSALRCRKCNVGEKKKKDFTKRHPVLWSVTGGACVNPSRWSCESVLGICTLWHLHYVADCLHDCRIEIKRPIPSLETAWVYTDGKKFCVWRNSLTLLRSTLVWWRLDEKIDCSTRQTRPYKFTLLARLCPLQTWYILLIQYIPKWTINGNHGRSIIRLFLR